VTDATGEPADSVLRLSAGEGFGLLLFRDCGELDGAWQASASGAFVGSINGFDQACLKMVPDGDPTPGWLARAQGYRLRGTERDLLAADGTLVARLLPGGKPRPAPQLIGSLQQPPTLDPATTQKLREVPAPLPAGTTPATATTIVGKWTPDPKPASTNGKEPFLQFDADGEWTDSDGCNGGGGRWALGSDGEFLSVAGAIAGVGCNGPVTEIPVDHTKRMAISGGVLTLYAADGHVLMRLTR
jgi:hypothetical protein